MKQAEEIGCLLVVLGGFILLSLLLAYYAFCYFSGAC